ADHQQHLLRGAHEAHHRLADPGGGVDHQHVQVVADVAERLNQTRVLSGRQVDHALCARCGRHDADTARALQQNVTQLASTLDDVGQGAFRGKSQQYVDVGQTQIGVQQHDAASKLGQCQ